jgi:hypothetical protein
MKTMMICAFAVVSLFSLGGCSHNTAGPTVPTNQAVDLKVPASEIVEVHCRANEDSFAKVGDAAGDAGRWTWNAAKASFEWITSQENKDRARRAYEATKEFGQKTFDAAVDEYHKVQQDKK